MSKVAFWESSDEYQLNVSCLKREALADHLSVMVLGIFSPTILLASVPSTLDIDFRTVTLATLSELHVPFKVTCDATGNCQCMCSVMK